MTYDKKLITKKLKKAIGYFGNTAPVELVSPSEKYHPSSLSMENGKMLICVDDESAPDIYELVAQAKIAETVPPVGSRIGCRFDEFGLKALSVFNHVIEPLIDGWVVAEMKRCLPQQVFAKEMMEFDAMTKMMGVWPGHKVTITPQNQRLLLGRLAHLAAMGIDFTVSPINEEWDRYIAKLSELAAKTPSTGALIELAEASSPFYSVSYDDERGCFDFAER